MKTVVIQTKIPSYRDYKRLIWTLREAKKFEMEEATRQAFILQDRLSYTGKQIVIEVGGKGLPENFYIAPIVGILRKGRWISEDCTLILRNNEKLSGTTVSI